MPPVKITALAAVTAAFFAVVGGATAAAQNISSVSGAEVKAGETAIEYRAAFQPDYDGKPEAFGHRLHFQHAVDDSWRVRALVFQSKKEGEALRTRYAAFEIQNELIEAKEHGGWASAVRVDGIIPVEDNRPGRARVAWLNMLDKGPWQFRGNIYLGKEFGDRARDGLTLETRQEATYKISSLLRLGAQVFDNYNTTAHFGAFAQQKHQVGPVAKWTLSNNVKVETSALFGVSKAAPDAELRLFACYTF